MGEPSDGSDTKQPSFGIRKFKAKSLIFDEGDEGDYVYLIRAGRVEIRGGTRTDAPRVLATLKPGDVFGELAIFDNRPRMAAAIAVEDTAVVSISRDEFHVQLERVDPAMKVIMQMMVRRVRQMTDEFAALRSEKPDVNWSKWKRET